MWTLPKFDWPQLREKCLSCAHLRTRVENEKHGSNHTILLCAVTPARTRAGLGSCIDNRTRGPCGTNATQWEGKP